MKGASKNAYPRITGEYKHFCSQLDEWHWRAVFGRCKTNVRVTSAEIPPYKRPSSQMCGGCLCVHAFCCFMRVGVMSYLCVCQICSNFDEVSTLFPPRLLLYRNSHHPAICVHENCSYPQSFIYTWTVDRHHG